jgi:putative ABC transport system substrate-binding protein
MGSLLAIPAGAAAQGAPRHTPRVGRISEGGPGDFTVFRAAMRLRGHPDVLIEDRPARGQGQRLPELAAELVQLGVDVIWSVGSAATGFAKAATQTIPIVMVSGDALGAGLVSNLARPGGNVTGLSLVGMDLVAKRLELLAQLQPVIKRVIAVIPGPDSSSVPFVVEWLRQGRAAADKLRLPFKFVELSADPRQWDAEFAVLAATRGTALAMGESPSFFGAAALLGELTLKHRLPAIFTFQENVLAGGLMAYGVTLKYITERVAYYIARVLAGTKPGDLSVEQPTNYELAINARTAKALGLTLPRSLLLRADRVIE